MRFYLTLLLMALVLGLGCESSTTDQDASSSLTTEVAAPEEPKVTSRTLTEADTFAKTQTAAQRIAPNFSVSADYPVLYKLLQENDQFPFVEVISVYALPASNLEAIQSEKQLLVLLQAQKNIVVALNNIADQIPNEAIEAKLPELKQELNPIGIDVKSANRKFAGFQSKTAFKSVIADYATDPIEYFTAFLNAQQKYQDADFSFKDMEAVRDMVLAGEKLMTDYPNSSHYQIIKTDFREAVLNFVGVYVMDEGGYTTERVSNPLIRSERFVAETETHKAFIQEHPNSIFTPVISKMLASPSRITSNPESLYAIYAGTASTLEEARQKQFDFLVQGRDILHILPYDAGKQQEGYLLACRFYEDETASLQCLDEAQKEAQSDAQYMMLSVNNNRLYQLGI